MRLLVLDLDGTLWDHEDASRFSPPYCFSDDCLFDFKGGRLCLFPAVKEFLEWTKGKFIISIASWNGEDKVKPILEGFGLWDYFVFPKIENHPYKGDMMLRTVRELENAGYTVGDVICVDDRDIHIDGVKSAVLSIRFIRMWDDVKSFGKLIQHIEKPR